MSQSSDECKIIAEVGSNFHTFEQAKDAISLAKACGADAVKFQMFTWREMYGYVLDFTITQCITEEWLPKLSEKAKAVGIEFMCTAFSPEGVKAVDPYVNTHKIASSDLTYPQLLDEVNRTRKPVYLSVGASSIQDIVLAMGHLPGVDVTLMYCVSSYPSYDLDLREIYSLVEIFHSDVGLSDHSKDIWTPVSAWHDYHTPVIEKHFNPFDLADTPDAPHSIGVEMFQDMVKRIRSKRVEFSPKRSEKDMFMKHNRRLVAIADIKDGDIFRYGKNFGCYRSREPDTVGASGFLWGEIHGRVSKTNLKLGQGISVGDVK